MRHFIVGNGPSLNETPLELLENEITWGMNRINLLYDRTTWRPTYYFMNDHCSLNPFEYWMECIQWHWHTPKWLWKVFRDGHPEGHPNREDIPRGIGNVPHTTWIDHCERHHYYQYNNGKAAKSWHLPELCTAFGGIYAVMQLAVLKGATEIYLLGCDLYDSDYSKNWFDPDYTGFLEERSKFDNEKMVYLHEVARRSSPVPIFNATIGGNLEVYERIDLCQLL